MASVTEEILLFLVTATRELLYNIVFRKGEEFEEEIDDRVLIKEFEKKVGHPPMDFFGLGNIVSEDWLEFLKNSQGLSVNEGRISIDKEDVVVYKHYNSRRLSIETFVADYREILLIQACKLIAGDRTFILENSKGPYHNTPLHLVTAMPGIAGNEPTLVQCLLSAGADPLKVNSDGLNPLHIIAGRIKAEVDEDGEVFFARQHINADIWEAGHRQRLLDVFSEEVSPACLAALMSKPGRDGNTAMHEWVLSTTTKDLRGSCSADQRSDSILKDIEIGSKLLKLGGNLWLQNQSGLSPLHFASNAIVFKFLVRNGGVCRTRNGRDETPFMFILKYLVVITFVNTSAFHEIKNFVVKGRDTSLEGNLEEAVVVLQEIVTLVNESDELKKTLWIADIGDVCPLEIVLLSVRCISYDLKFTDVWNLTKFRDNLMELLHHILQAGDPDHLKSKNKKGQSPLHVLLDMSSSNTNSIHNEAEILRSMLILLQRGADVNALDVKGQTVLDVLYEYGEKIPSLFEICSDVLLQNGARHGYDIQQNGEASAFVNAMSTVNNGKVKRKLRSCPKRHFKTALKLSEAKTDVTTVQKYRYFCQLAIGSGAFSSIYVAIKDEHFDKISGTIDCRAIALKRLEKSKINPQEVSREVKTLLSISTGCENILNCYETIEDEYFHYLSLDLMDGDLRQFIEDSPAKSMMQDSPTSSAKAAQDIINGLVYLHEQDFLHRDLKPGNILYTVEPSLHFKIGDFGLAKNISTTSTMMTAKADGVATAPGTRCWMAPELVSLNSREHTKESDVFALGLVLHFLLSFGKHPFVGITEEPAHVTERKIEDLQISIHGSLSSEASSFVANILAKDPRKRPPAKYLGEHPFLWSEKKKIEFLIAVGNQPEAVNPNSHPNSRLEQLLQKTKIGKQFHDWPWDRFIPELYRECTNAWRQKRYRTDNVLDLVRFLRNAYAHREERSPVVKSQLDDNIFLRAFPSLVLEVLGIIQKVGYENWSNISQTLLME